MTPTNPQKYLRWFIGLIHYYHNMWEIHSHTLEPSTKITSSKVKFKLTKIEQEELENINQIVAHSILLAYLGFNK